MYSTPFKAIKFLFFFGLNEITYTESLPSYKVSSILKKYHIFVNEYDKKIVCPFSFHNDKTASFYFYQNTNSFFCFGCKSGGGPVQFVSLIEGISKHKAIQKLLSEFDIDPDASFGSKDYDEKQNINLEFSKLIRNFLNNSLEDPSSFEYAENISKIFDSICQKHSLDIDGLKLLINRLEDRLKEYNPYK